MEAPMTKLCKSEDRGSRIADSGGAPLPIFDRRSSILGLLFAGLVSAYLSHPGNTQAQTSSRENSAPTKASAASSPTSAGPQEKPPAGFTAGDGTKAPRHDAPTPPTHDSTTPRFCGSHKTREVAPRGRNNTSV